MIFDSKASPPLRSLLHICLSLFLVVMFSACGGSSVSTPASYQVSEKKLARIDYTIQAGVFNNLDNALRLTEDLREKGISAYYFVYKKGVYKVRFGDYPSKEMALLKAKKLERAGLIDDYYVVSPEESPAYKSAKYGGKYLRGRIVSTAESFLGVPYRWGGNSRRGFDCSGLSMTVYTLNGLKLPRNSRAQYKAGTPVQRYRLARGDLVFFATSGGRKVSHVGIYIGGDKFIHAPSKGKKVQTESLKKSYYAKRYIGARRYF
ncbi:MAG: NlpC/P60 family protein [Thermodesulfovibrionales bacterium]